MDIVFANRNREYGAYQLRQMSGKATNIALIIVFTVVGGLCGISLIEKAEDAPTLLTDKFSHTITIEHEVNLQEEIIEIKPEEAKVQQIAKDVSAKDLIKYTEINPTDKINVTEDIAAESEVLDKQKLLSSFTAKGQKGGELIARGTFGVRKQDGGSIGRSIADEEGTAKGDTFTAVEIMPAPTEGMPAFIQWIATNYTFPQAALDNNVKGVIQVKFIVEKDGSLSSFEVLRDMGLGTGKEAVRLLQKAKKWNPGVQNGRPVRVTFSLPIRLSIN
ncbi:energy transducer TonB [Sphingobacterium composti Ten et al. 2007 non Yoo et al. 2007]|uniref:energy transducer TonB n=1 Tax=Sphingobacterium composti TaxID=363260 RepID=UPI001F3790C2|nr:energy transducer TonB [Sphingobacterium composti Ten et al. 2007 non Yoo et al. 2007]